MGGGRMDSPAAHCACSGLGDQTPHACPAPRPPVVGPLHLDVVARHSLEQRLQVGELAGGAGRGGAEVGVREATLGSWVERMQGRMQGPHLEAQEHRGGLVAGHHFDAACGQGPAAVERMRRAEQARVAYCRTPHACMQAAVRQPAAGTGAPWMSGAHDSNAHATCGRAASSGGGVLSCAPSCLP